MLIRRDILNAIIISWFVVGISGFFGCELPVYTPDPPSSTPTPLPQRSIIFQEENGERHFYTNEVKNLGSKGSSFWVMGDVLGPVMGTFEAQCRKVSGDMSAGYGLIFSVKDINNFLTVLINTKGNYLIGKIKDDVFSSIQTWTSSALLISGNSAVNSIKVIYNSSTNHYEVYFNGTKETEFEDNSAPIFDETACFGYIVCISPYENYPAVGTDIYFKQVLPLDINL